MSESEIINSTPFLRTRESLAADLRRAGISPGICVLVHSSLSSLGWVNGGAVTVVQALMDAVTLDGTLVMPAHSGEYSDPSKWGNPPVPERWWEPIRETMPAFDPRYTPTRGMGAIAEAFRSFPGVCRSSHPAVSFTAWGKQAAFITENHTLDYCMGENSPLARLYDLDGWILLLGVGYDHCSSMHLAEYRVSQPTPTVEGAPIFENGQRVWKTYADIALDSDRFPSIGADFEWEHPVVVFGDVGSAQARLMRQRTIVDYTVQWLEERGK
jgi:aminoglycoside 3-N-acetyltransferase